LLIIAALAGFSSIGWYAAQLIPDTSQASVRLPCS
jgi:hypothetical protein